MSQTHTAPLVGQKYFLISKNCPLIGASLNVLNAKIHKIRNFTFKI